MDRINHLNKIKEYEKQLKQKCKMHRQVSYGYTTTNNPVKRQLAKLSQAPPRDISIAHERVDDPYMHSIELARNSQLNDYVFKNADVFLTNIKTEQEGQTIPEEQELTPELLADGWRKIEDSVTKNYMYINIFKGGAPQQEFPSITRATPVGKPKITLYTSRGQTYYVNSSTGVITRTLPSGFTEDDVITSNIDEPEESERFINYYKPKFNQRVRGNRVVSDNGLRQALRKDINKIFSHPTIFNFFNNYRYLLNKDLLESSSRKELVKQYKSILNILAHHESETPLNFEPFSSITAEFNKARREGTTVNVDHDDTIEGSIQSGEQVEPDKYDYIRFSKDIENMLALGVDREGNQLTQEEIDILNQRLQTIRDHSSYTGMLIDLRDTLASGVASDGTTPLTQEEIELINQRIAETEERVRNIEQELETIPTDPTDLRQPAPAPPTNTTAPASASAPSLLSADPTQPTPTNTSDTGDTLIDKLPTNTTNTTDIAFDPDGRELSEP